MAPQAKPTTQPRAPLSRERVLRAAVAFADSSSISSLSMRKLGEVLGVEAMSLYNHVANKGALLDGRIDLAVRLTRGRVTDPVSSLPRCHR